MDKRQQRRINKYYKTGNYIKAQLKILNIIEKQMKSNKIKQGLKIAKELAKINILRSNYERNYDIARQGT